MYEERLVGIGKDKEGTVAWCLTAQRLDSGALWHLCLAGSSMSFLAWLESFSLEMAFAISA